MAENIAESEYSAQLFGFTPETFFKDFSEMLLNEMYAYVQHYIKQVSSPNSKLTNKDEVIHASIQFHDTLCRSAEAVLKKLEPTIKEFFTIPKNVLLPPDEALEKQHTQEDISKLEEEINELEAMYEKELSTMQMYKAELVMLEAVEPELQKVNNAVGILDQIEATVKEIEELEKLAQMHQQYQKKLFANDTTEDDHDGEDCVDIIIASKFKHL